MSASPAYTEVLDFLAGGTTPETLVAFRPSPDAQSRVADLVARSQAGTITAEEQNELADTLQLEHLMILAKARARQKLSPTGPTRDASH
jgi:hypothetical protein